MGKILAKSGDSLADVYDVKGSIAGVEELLTEDVTLVHELGATIFSERLAARIFTLTVAPGQSANFDINFALGNQTARVLGIAVFEAAPLQATVLRDCSVAITSPPAQDNSDLTLFTWDATTGGSEICRVLIAGVLTNLNRLVPVMPQGALPTLAVGADQASPANVISLRGTTTAFGAGTVAVTCQIHVAFPQLGGVSSRGLPLPGW